MLRILWIGVLCVWCVNAQKMRPIVVNNRLQSKNDTNSDEIQIGSDGNENSRQTRQLNPGWTPIPAVWSPRVRSALNTWWGLPWPFENGQSLVRIQPPSPYWEDYRHHEHDGHHHHHHHHPHDHHHDHHDHHHDHHHDDHHHKPPHPGLYPGMGMYIAQNLGALHIAPLPGHIGTVIASNMNPALGTFPPNPFFNGPFSPFGPPSIDIAPPFAPAPAIPPPPPPSPAPPAAPSPVPPPLPTPLARTW